MFSRKRGVLKAKKRDEKKDSANNAPTPPPTSFFARILGNSRGTASCIDLSKSEAFFSIPGPIDESTSSVFLNGEKVSVVSLPDAAGDEALEKRKSSECRRSETMPGSHELMVNGRNSFQPIASGERFGAAKYEEAIPVMSSCQEKDGNKTEEEKKKVLSTGKPNGDVSSSIPSVTSDPVSTSSSSSSPEIHKLSIKRWDDVSRMRLTPVSVNKKSFAIHRDDSSSFSRCTTEQDFTREDDICETVNAVVEKTVEKVLRGEQYEQMVDAVVQRMSAKLERRLEGIERRLSILCSLLLPTNPRNEKTVIQLSATQDNSRASHQLLPDVKEKKPLFAAKRDEKNKSTVDDFCQHVVKLPSPLLNNETVVDFFYNSSAPDEERAIKLLKDTDSSAVKTTAKGKADAASVSSSSSSAPVAAAPGSKSCEFTGSEATYEEVSHNTGDSSHPPLSSEYAEVKTSAETPNSRSVFTDVSDYAGCVAPGANSVQSQ